MNRVYAGTGRHFQEIQAVPLDEESLRDIQRRVKLQPHFLGEPLVVIAEGEDFAHIGGGRFTMLALDAAGRSVAISLGVGAADIEQFSYALEIAAHVASLRPYDLGKIARSFIMRPQNDALRRSWEEVGVEMSEEAVELPSLLAAQFQRDAGDYAEVLNAEQRILISAEGFTTRLVDAAEWLIQSGVQILGIEYKKYLLGGQEIYFAEQILPTPDPAIDAPQKERRPPEEIEPWRTRGRLYHLERLSPAVGTLLDQLLLGVKPSTFSINWNSKYYFWIRGTRRNLRIRTYHRERLEIGFDNISPEALASFLVQHDLGEVDVYMIGGYIDSPFVALTAEMTLDGRWLRMLNNWLGGSTSQEMS